MESGCRPAPPLNSCSRAEAAAAGLVTGTWWLNSGFWQASHVDCTCDASRRLGFLGGLKLEVIICLATVGWSEARRIMAGAFCSGKPPLLSRLRPP